MAGYYNPYTAYQNSNYPIMGGASFTPYASYVPSVSSQVQPTYKTMEWVQGEVGAKAFQMPPGMPPNQVIPLWDSTDNVVYFKSWSPMGFPNPLQKSKYEMEDVPQNLPAETSGQEAPVNNYVSKEEFDNFREELREIKDMISKQNIKNQRYKQEDGHV